MKTLIFFSLLILSTLSFADGEPTLDSVFATPTNLTEQQTKDAENFNHVGKKQAIYDKECAENPSLSKCDVNKASSDGVVIKGSLGGAVEQHIGKLYAVLFGGLDFLSGKGPTVKVKKDPSTQTATTPATTGKEKSGEEITAKSDYCAYAAIGYEAAATVLQVVLQKKATTDSSLAQDPQMQALIALKETHKARKTTSTIQASVYTATAACYIARATGKLDKGKVVLDWKYWTKMSAASGLATLFWIKASKHAKAMDAVQTVIDSLPKTGQCNPWTDTACFCSEATSKATFPTQFQEVCVLNKGNVNTPKIALGCVTTDASQKAVFDQECNCKKTNSCVRAAVSGYSPQFSFGSSFMGQANQGFDMLSSGNFDQGQFDKYSLQNGVLAAKVKDLFVAKTPTVALSDAQKKEAGELSSILPPSVAALAAASHSYSPSGAISNDGTSSALANLPNDVKKKVEDISQSAKYKSTGAGFDSVSSNEEPTFQLPNMAPAQTQQNTTEVLSFAEQAIEKADVNNAPDTPIFDIISNRYRRSGWTKLQPEEEKK